MDNHNLSGLTMKICGIYKIERLSDGAIYIGQSVNIKSRFNLHRHHLRKGKHSNQHLQNAFNKYGEGDFAFSLIEECEDHDLDYLEQHYLDQARISGKVVFNCGDVATCPNRGRKLGPLSEEHRKKISESVKGYKKSDEERRVISERSKGRIVSDASRKKMSEAKLGKKLSEETRAKLSIAKKGKPHKVSEEARQKLIERNKSMVWTQEMRKNMSKVKTGFKHSEEAKQKCREASLNYWKEIANG